MALWLRVYMHLCVTACLCIRVAVVVVFVCAPRGRTSVCGSVFVSYACLAVWLCVCVVDCMWLCDQACGLVVARAVVCELPGVEASSLVMCPAEAWPPGGGAAQPSMQAVG